MFLVGDNITRYGGHFEFYKNFRYRILYLQHKKHACRKKMIRAKDSSNATRTADFYETLYLFWYQCVNDNHGPWKAIVRNARPIWW